MKKCIDNKNHKYRITGKRAECVICGFTRTATKAQLARADKIERQIGARFSRALSQVFNAMA